MTAFVALMRIMHIDDYTMPTDFNGDCDYCASSGRWVWHIDEKRMCLTCSLARRRAARAI